MLRYRENRLYFNELEKILEITLKKTSISWGILILIYILLGMRTQNDLRR